MKKILFLILTTLVMLSSCIKDKPQDVINPTINLSTDAKIYIINEGPFNTGNGSISLYNPASNNVNEDFYFQQNSIRLGNIVQSMTKVNNEYCICVNNSGKVVFCDKNFKKTHEISGLVSPRYIQQVSYQKAYVTDLYANSISIINLINYNKTSSIICYGKSEKMLQLYNEVYVTNTDKEYIFIINVINDNITDSIYVGYNCYGIEIDQNNKIWALSSGKSTISNGKLSKINPATHQIENSFVFQNNESPNYLCFNKTKDTLYYVNTDIYRMHISSNNLPTNYFIQKGIKNFYGLGINPNDYNVYISDPMGFTQKSNIYIYNSNGTQLSVFKTDIGSNSFYFE